MKNKEKYDRNKDNGIGYFLEHFKGIVGAEMLWKIYKHWAEQEVSYEPRSRHCSLVLHEVTEDQCQKIKEEHEIDEEQINE